MRGFRTEIFVALVLVVVTLAVYSRVLDYGFVDFDDSKYVADNSYVRTGLSAENFRWAWTTLHASNWHPLTWLSLQFDAELFRGRAWGFHFTNVLLHTLNTVLLFVVLRAMTGALWPSAVVAALFAWHPLHVESVAWIAERKDVLSTFFWLMTMGEYVLYVRRPGWGRYALVLVFFALGLLAKPMLVTLPCVLLLLDYWPLLRLSSRKTFVGLVWEKLPLFALAAASSAMTWHAQQAGRAMASLANLPLGARASNAVVALTTYLGKMALPNPRKRAKRSNTSRSAGSMWVCSSATICRRFSITRRKQ